MYNSFKNEIFPLTYGRPLDVILIEKEKGVCRTYLQCKVQSLFVK